MQIEPSLSYYQMMMPHTTNLIDLEVVATSVSGTIDNRQSTIDNRYVLPGSSGAISNLLGAL